MRYIDTGDGTTTVPCLAAGEYTGSHRDIAKKVKTGDGDAILAAACALAVMLPRHCTLVPVPSHTGRATYTLEICRRMAPMLGARVCDCLRGKPGASLCGLKNEEYTKGLPKGTLMPPPESLGLSVTGGAGLSGHIFAIDNVVASGTTAAAVAQALPEAVLACIAFDASYPKVGGVGRILTESQDRCGQGACSLPQGAFERMEPLLGDI